MNIWKKKIRKWYLSLLCALLFVMVIPFQARAELPFVRSGNYMNVNGTIYRQNNVDASTYVPFDSARSLDNTNTLAQLLSLPGAQTGYGSWAKTAAFRYQGFSGLAGSNSQYLVKYAAVRTIANHGSQGIEPAYYQYNGNRMLSFRYIGMVINSSTDSSSFSGLAIAGTNPQFPSDTLQQGTSYSTVPTSIEVYSRNIDSTSRAPVFSSHLETAYGTTGGVHQLADVFTNGMNGTSAYAANGNIPTNKYSGMNASESLAKQAFERWLSCSDGYGKAYKEQAETWIVQNGSSLSWWQVLNQFFQINGDPESTQSTLYFYMVGGKMSGHNYYTTYSTKGYVEKNATPTLFAIKDNESGEILSESYRISSHMDSGTGAGSEKIGKEVKLKANKKYTLEGILSYYSVKEESSKATRGLNLCVLDKTGLNSAVDLSANMIACSALPDGAALNHVGPTDRKSNGTIKASGNKTEKSDGISFYYNGACFSNTGFYVTNEMPLSGYLMLIVPDSFGEAGDNDVMNDDRIVIPYVVIADEEPIPAYGQAAFGDLNLGMPEYRDLHYIAQYEIPVEEDEDADEDAEPPEPEIVTEERYSGYGYYKSAEGAPKSEISSNEEPRNENRVDIWDAGSPNEMGDSEAISNGWWEYTSRIWPNQTEDLENKCWLTDGNGAWNQSGEFMRSKAGEHSFGFGFRVSRSRGDKGTTLSSAALEVQIYGVSPDTGEDGVLLQEYTDGGKDFKTLRTGSIGVYEFSDTKYTGIVSSAAINGIENFPRIRVVSKISKDIHGESGICLNSSVYKEPAENSWEEEHDTVDRTFEAVMDDMRIMEVELKDAEGIVVYNANRYGGDDMEVEVNGYYDKEEDLFLKVVVEQNIDSGHAVYEPTIDVSIRGVNTDGAEESTYINQSFTLNDVSMGGGVQVTFNDIAFRPRSAHKLRINIEINEKHGADQWRENIWDNSDDAYGFTLEGTAADLGLTQNIEVYNSKGNPQEFLTFAEYLSFKFDIRHIGRNARQTAIVGGSEINPYAKVNVNIYNADALSLDPINGNIIYRMATQDPKAAAALIRSGDIQAATRLYPGLGMNDFASHVQAWFKNYIVQSFVTDTDNVAAYGRILVTGNIDSFHDTNNTNIRNNSTDYVQQEFIGEKNFKIVDLGVSSRNSISAKTGIAIQIAAQNSASSYNDQTVVDKTYIDIYIDDKLLKTIEVEIPIGDTIVTEAIIDDVDLEQCKVVEVRINTGKHQTHYEYVAKSTDSSLYPDPFTDNYMSIIVCPNKPNETICPLCVIDDNVAVDSIFGGGAGGGETPIVPDHDNVTDTSKYSIVFEANDGSADNKTQTIEYNSSVNLMGNTFSRTGYIFTGWNTMEDGSGTAYADKAVLSIGTKQSYGENTTLTLYAQWKVITYQIAFDANGGTGTMENINCTFDEAQYLPANKFEKSGCMFSGWNTRADGSGISVDNGGSIKNFTDVQGKVVTLYAQWIAEMDCIILENFVASSTIDLKPGDMIAENPSLMSLVDYSSYGYLMVKIPTVSATKNGETIEKIYDLFSLDWNSADWTKVYEKHGAVEGEQSVYVWRYSEILAPKDTNLNNPNSTSRKSNHTTDLYSRMVKL